MYTHMFNHKLTYIHLYIMYIFTYAAKCGESACKGDVISDASACFESTLFDELYDSSSASLDPVGCYEVRICMCMNVYLYVFQ